MTTPLSPTAGELRVSVVVPVRDGGPAFQEVLAALGRLSPPAHEVIVVEDGPDQTPCAYGERVTAVRLPKQQGPAAARNAGARRATGDVLFFLDADVVARADAVAQVQQALADDDIDAVFGSYDRQPRAPGFVSQFKNLSHHFVHQQAREEAQTFWSGCGAIRWSVFERLGGFDERFTVPSIEDIELGMRLRAAGGRIRVVKALQVTHLKAWTLRSMIRTDVLGRAIPWSRLLLAAGTLPDDLNLAWRARAAAALAWLLPATLAAAFASAWWLVPAAAAVAGLATLDQRLWRFFAAERGWWFGLRAMPLQWLYYLYSSASFCWVALTERHASRVAARERRPVA